MASRGKLVCRKAGCGKLIAASGWCDEHKTLRCGWHTTSKESSHRRGYGAAWRRLREVILNRDGGLCQVCLNDGIITIATEVDHIISKANGGTNDEYNLQSICSPHHNEKTAKERNAQ
jgi:5-methylcytosine-specific restriction protein A